MSSNDQSTGHAAPLKSGDDQSPGRVAAPGRRGTALSIAAALAVFIDRVISSALSGTLILLLLFTVLSITDLSGFNARGMENVKNRDLKQLVKINPDTAAWLILDGTHIDYPVVQGKDNFEYLDLDLYRNFYAGGSLFLDCQNRKDFSDSYNVIHGHHMSEGAMFGDLDRFLDRDFLDENHSGRLITPACDYRLEVAASGRADAYDTAVYNVKGRLKTHVKAILESAANIRNRRAVRSVRARWRASTQAVARRRASGGTEARSSDTTAPARGRTGRNEEKDGAAGILVLSTCTGAMDDSRTIVVCVMYQENNGASAEAERDDASAEGLKDDASAKA